MPDQSKTQVVRLVAKSYIARIGFNYGWPEQLLPIPNRAALDGLGLLFDIELNEDPRDDGVRHGRNQGYRMRSEYDLTIEYAYNSILSVSVGPPQSDVGLEYVTGSFAWEPPPIRMWPPSGSEPRRTDDSTFEFDWTAKGRPNILPVLSMESIAPRASVTIWHRVSCQIRCSGSRLDVSATLTGSRFPSHRLFVDGGCVQTKHQGPLLDLWVPAGVTNWNDFSTVR